MSLKLCNWARSRTLVSYLTVLLCLAMVSPTPNASEYQALEKPAHSRQPTKATSAELNNQSSINRKEIALDSEGKPLPLPTEDTAGLEFDMQDYLQSAQGGMPSSSKSTAKQSTSKQSSAKKPSGKKKASGKRDEEAVRVANDPGCRWLDDRIQLLQQFIDSKAGGSHHRDELAARRSEWRCMDCGGDGPDSADHARCQYRR